MVYANGRVVFRYLGVELLLFMGKCLEVWAGEVSGLQVHVCSTCDTLVFGLECTVD